MPRTLTVHCPDCGADLVIDAKNGKVLGHEKKDKDAPPDEKVFDDALGRVHSGPKSSFDKAMESLDKRKKSLEDTLADAKRRAAERKEERPRSPFEYD